MARKTDWQHPLATALRRRYPDALSLQEALESEVEAVRASCSQVSKVIEKESPAVDIEGMLRELGVSVSYSTDVSPHEATVSRGARGYRIAIRKPGKELYRYRFSLAHELGHICLSEGAWPLSPAERRLAATRQEQEEALCNAFAGGLLVPRDCVPREWLTGGAPTTEDFLRLARALKVSRTVLLQRISQLIPALLVLWDVGSNPRRKESRDKLRVKRVVKPIGVQLQAYIPAYVGADRCDLAPNPVSQAFLRGVSEAAVAEVSHFGTLQRGKYHVVAVHMGTFARQLPGFSVVDPSVDTFVIGSLLWPASVEEVGRAGVPSM